MKNCIKLVSLFVVALLIAPSFIESVNAADGYKIMSYNVRNGRGLDEKTDYERTCAVILAEDPEIVAIQELDQKTARSKGVDVLEELAKITKMYSAFGPAIDYQGGKYGIGVLSKEKPLSVKYYPLPGSEEKRCLLVVELEKYVFCCAHWSLTEKDRNTTVKIITDKMKEQKKPVVLCGDFNAELNEDSIVELKKNWALLNADDNTFPADKPNVHIDYVCGADPTGKINLKQWENAVQKTYVIDEKVASDHRPVVVILNADLLN